MRYLLLLCFCFLQLGSFGQFINKYPILVKELREEFKNNLLRGGEFQSSLTMDSLGNFKVNTWNVVNESYSKNLLSVLSSTQEHLSVGDYFVSIYWDLYSDKVYAAVGTTVSQRNILAQHHSLNPSPYRMIEFSRAMRFDLEKGLSLDSLNKKWITEGWYNGLEMYLDKDGRVDFDLTNSMSGMLDSTRLMRWTPSIVYGQKRNTVILLKFKKNEIGNGKDFFSNLVHLKGYYLDERYEGAFVRFEEDPSFIPYGKSVVSFVLNPVTDKFENPFIHRGEIQLGKDLILWIEKYDFSNLPFYAPNYPAAKRVYFYLK